MGSVVAIANQKGGVGKTAVTLGLSSAAALAGDRVLVVDLDPQGRVRWVRDVTAIDRDPSGQVAHFIGYLFESTARPEALEAMAEARREAEAATVATTEFLTNVSHELRTPLTGLHGNLDMREPADAPAGAPMLADLRAQSKRQAHLVEDLQTLSRLEGQPDLPEERVAMAPLVAALKREAEGLSQGRHTIVAEARCGHDLRGSPQYLHSAFSNLVSNAVRYTPPGGRVEIRWTPRGDGAEFSVADTGQGIPPEHLPRITERFYRVSTSRSRASGGTGLGLSIVKHVLGLHGARLEIESELGAGSRFACVFDAGRLVDAAHAEEEHAQR
jgi:two-component system phosphate regulon sensor histidine kinase PhoR